MTRQVPRDEVDMDLVMSHMRAVTGVEIDRLVVVFTFEDGAGGAGAFMLAETDDGIKSGTSINLVRKFLLDYLSDTVTPDIEREIDEFEGES